MNLENDIKRGKELEAKARPPYGGDQMTTQQKRKQWSDKIAEVHHRARCCADLERLMHTDFSKEVWVKTFQFYRRLFMREVKL